VTGRRLSAFLDALAAGRRPRRFKARDEDVPLIRTAIDLRASRPGEADPDEQFVADLHRRLSEQARTADAPGASPARPARGRLALVAVAASATLVAGTAAVTETVVSAPSATTARQVPRGDALRTGTFVAAGNRVVGQIVAYRGDPSWVYMKVSVPHYDGPVTCELQAADGSVVAFGTFDVHGGTGQFSKTLKVAVGDLRGARLVTPTRSPLASATFA
jgi:hypothetical protein